MKNTDPESSFQSPDDYKDCGEDATEAMMVYQRVRRPLMFHILLVLVFFIPKGQKYSYTIREENEAGEITAKVIEWDPGLLYWMIHNAGLFFYYLIWALPVLGIISLFRRLEDGFQEEGEPAFFLEVVWVKPRVGASDAINPFIEKSVWNWFWKTWIFYPAILWYVLLAMIGIVLKGLGLFMDVFFLRCWDKWYYAINAEGLEEKNKQRIIRGSKLFELAKTSGTAPINYIKNKLSKRELEKDLKEKRKQQRSDEQGNQESPRDDQENRE